MITIDRQAFENRSSSWNRSQNRILHPILRIDNNTNGLNRIIDNGVKKYERGVIMMQKILKTILEQENQVVQALNSQSELQNDVWKKLFKQDSNLKTAMSSFNESILGVKEKLTNQMSNVFNSLLEYNEIASNNTHRLQYVQENMNQSWSSILMNIEIIRNLVKINTSHNNSLFHDLQFKKLMEIEMGKKAYNISGSLLIEAI